MSDLDATIHESLTAEADAAVAAWLAGGTPEAARRVREAERALVEFGDGSMEA